MAMNDDDVVASAGASPKLRPGASPFVNYEAVAERYAVGRTGSKEDLALWRGAAGAHVPRRPALIADIGSGTGIFARAWANWTDADVIGVEPSSAMLRSATSEPVARVSYVQGVVEKLPLAAHSVDVAWVSTAFHHFADQHRAASELARILATDGRVMLRGVVRDRTLLSWLALFPGRDKALRRYPSQQQLESIFAGAGLHLVEIGEVFESGRTGAEQANWVENMRDADSILTALSDDEIAVGVRLLRRRGDDAMPVALTLAVFG